MQVEAKAMEVSEEEGEEKEEAVVLRGRMLMLMVKKIRPTSNAIIVRSTATTNHSVGTRRV